MENIKGIDKFKKTVKAHLDKIAEGDEVFAGKLRKINMDLCVAYIANCVKELGREALTDDEVYSIAVHYVDEEGNVKVDPHIFEEIRSIVSPGDLTEEERQEARRKAVEELKLEEKEKMKGNKKQKSQTQETGLKQLELF